MNASTDIATVRDLRRQQIIRAARDIVATDGLHRLTFSALEERLSFTRGVITYHFKNKDEIVLALLHQAVADIDAATSSEIEASMTFEDRVRAMVAATIRGFLNQPEASAVLVSFWSRLLTDPRLAEVNASLYQRWRQYTQQVLESAPRALNHDPQAMAVLVVGIVIGVVTQTYFDKGTIDVEAVIEVAVRTLLAGLGQK